MFTFLITFGANLSLNLKIGFIQGTLKTLFVLYVKLKYTLNQILFGSVHLIYLKILLCMHNFN